MTEITPEEAAEISPLVLPPVLPLVLPPVLPDSPWVCTGQVYTDSAGMMWMLFVGQPPLMFGQDSFSLYQGEVSADDEYKKLEPLLSKVFKGAAESRKAQEAISAVSHDTAAVVAEDLKVESYIRSPHANYFLQQLIVSHFDAVSDIVLGKLRSCGLIWTARHRFGCRIMCRIAERIAPGSHGERTLVEMLSTEGSERLPFTEFGRHVVITCIKSSVTAVSQAALKVVSDSWTELARSHKGRLCLEEAAPYDERLCKALAEADPWLKAIAGKYHGTHYLRAAVRQAAGSTKDPSSKNCVA